MNKPPTQQLIKKIKIYNGLTNTTSIEDFFTQSVEFQKMTEYNIEVQD